MKAQDISTVPAIEAGPVQRTDILDVEALAKRGVDPAVARNIEVFGSLTPRLADNLRVAAISPFSGRAVAPVSHFGIDSDPWMHAIAFRDDGRPFIVFCRGLTETCVFGSLYIPDRNLLLEERSGWYFRDVYCERIDRNLPRALRYFAGRGCGGQPQPLDGSSIAAAIGNCRVGDFIMQLAWLQDLLLQDVTIARLFVNKSSEFIDPVMLFPELSDALEKQDTAVHIEHRAHRIPQMLLSDVRSLAHRDVANRLSGRFSSALVQLREQAAARRLLAPLTACPLTIWISLELEKRVWVEQAEALPELLTAIASDYLGKDEALGIVLNGFTGTEHGVSADLRRLVEHERREFEALLGRIRKPYCAVSAAGHSLGAKAVFADRCDLVVAPIGSASIIPSKLLGKPGIVYGARAISRAGFVGSQTVAMPDRLVREVRDVGGHGVWSSSSSVSYRLDWRRIHEALQNRFECARGSSGRLLFSRRS